MAMLVAMVVTMLVAMVVAMAMLVTMMVAMVQAMVVAMLVAKKRHRQRIHVIALVIPSVLFFLDLSDSLCLELLVEISNVYLALVSR